MIRWHTILPLVQKDLRLYFGNRFYAFITALSLAATRSAMAKGIASCADWFGVLKTAWM